MLLLWCTMCPLSGGEEIVFNRDIRPLLSDRCFQCHGPDETHREADLRLDIATGEMGAHVDADGVGAIVPGNLDDSELWNRISTDDEDLRMPPADANKKPLSKRELAAFRQWISEGAKYDQFWAFVPPQRTLHNRTGEWQRNLVDQHVFAKLETLGLTPNEEADRRTLIRRLTFDLTGLPPTIEEVRAFVADDSPGAYARLVDRLLNNSAYGENMARYWADLVRLADTNGMHKDFYRNFSAYREWLIRSFNENLSFDEFIRYQLAGDLFDEPTEDQLVASGFNRLHLIIDRGTALPEESRHKNILDRVEAFGTSFLGLTVQCAQCHDHKFDPITQKEYYQLYAFFNNFDGDPETAGAPKGGIQQPAVELTSLGVSPGSKLAMVMKEKSEPDETRILMRGSYEHPGELVERNTPAFLPPMKQKETAYTRMDLVDWLVKDDHPLTARVAVNRIWQQFFGVGLVKTSEDFGQQGEWPRHSTLLDELAVEFVESGWDVKRLVRLIVMSSTYRQSSDATDAEFRKDPENRNLARGSRYKLDAEMIRDQIILLSGKLNREMFGESVKPPQPAGLWKAVSMARPFTYVADKGKDIYRRSFYSYWRRAMPPPQMTILNAPSREFCTPRRERTNTPLQALLLMNEQEYFRAARDCAQRTLEEVEHQFAGGEHSESDDDSAKEKRTLIHLHEKVTSHVPDDSRLSLLSETLDAFRQHYVEAPQLADALTNDIADLSQDDRTELAAWTMLTHGLFNLELTTVKR